MAPRAPAPPSKSQCLQTQVTTVRYGAVDTRLLLLLAASKQKTHCRSGFTSQHRSGWAHRRKRPSKTGSSEINNVSVGAAYFLSSSQKGKSKTCQARSLNALNVTLLHLHCCAQAPLFCHFCQMCLIKILCLWRLYGLVGSWWMNYLMPSDFYSPFNFVKCSFLFI